MGAGSGEEGGMEDIQQEPTGPSTAGTFVISGGFDKNVLITSADDWIPVRRLEGHSGHVLSCDVTGDAKWIVSGGYDRTVKLWGVS